MCDYPDCEKPVRAKGLCGGHYQQQRFGEPLHPLRKRTPKHERCTYPGCPNYHSSHGLCPAHLRQREKGALTPVGMKQGYKDGHVYSTTYTAVHNRIRRTLGKASRYQCVECGRQAQEWAYDHSDPAPLTDERGHTYSSDPLRYEPMCKSCHSLRDHG